MNNEIEFENTNESINWHGKLHSLKFRLFPKIKIKNDDLWTISNITYDEKRKDISMVNQ